LAGPVRRGSDRAVVNWPYDTRERSWSWNRIERPDSLRRVPPRRWCSAHVAVKGARKATLMLLREMQRCTDSVKREW